MVSDDPSSVCRCGVNPHRPVANFPSFPGPGILKTFVSTANHTARPRFVVGSRLPASAKRTLSVAGDCHDRKSGFNVLSGPVMQKTRAPLQKGFLAVGLATDARKSLSSCPLTRDLDLNRKIALYMQRRIRSEMASKRPDALLPGIVEADETCLGGKLRESERETGWQGCAQITKDLTGRGMPQCWGRTGDKPVR